MMHSLARCRLLILSAAALCSCAQARKIESVRSGAYVPGLALAEEVRTPDVPVEALVSDTMMIKDADGRDLIIMKAVRDENGEMVASDVIVPSVVVATFRNVAERLGMVDLRFDLSVPADLTDSRWQLRLFPVMHIMGEEVALDPVYITGTQYRAAQLRGYERYARFIDGIITDTTLFIRKKELELFLKRNLPELYAFREDSTRVSDEQWKSAFGVTGAEAVEYYTDHYHKRINERKAGRKDKMFRRYVKAPMRTEALRLDTVVVAASGDISYGYVQTIHTRPNLKKVEIELLGGVYEEDREICRLPSPGKLTFYISSLSSFAEDRERFLTKVVSRRVEANTSCFIEFGAGKTDIREELGMNASEMGRIKGSIRDILEDDKYDLDSVVITAFASPDGSSAANDRLALRRAGAASDFFAGYTSFLIDSLCIAGDISKVNFVSHGGGENWDMFEQLANADTLIPPSDLETIHRKMEIRDPDGREASLRGLASYPYLRKNIYPRLRTVRFDFHLHRKGMVKDTIHTTIPDTVYMQGVQALKDRDYERALALLQPYRDYNTAVAYLSLGKNHNALEILDRLSPTPQTDYMKAVIYSRFGDGRNAVQHYLDACSVDKSLVFRGSLDPEIAALIKYYNLNLYDQ
ncbi:MAG: hypothetical protein IKX45_07375 [Bacteroidales bacterium]|nr:hypothetical protein [Bacteroidales bacterium]